MITANQGFDETYYLTAKANAMTLASGQTVTPAQAKAAMAAAGLTPAQHYSLYGFAEGLAPNAYFNADQYAASKAAAAGMTVAQFELAWYNATGSTNLYAHYALYGAYETGVSPSTGFNDASYYAAKAAKDGSTVAAEMAAFKAAGLTPIAHYLQYGINEGLSYTPTAITIIGQTYTLTTGVDAIVGTAGNDTIVGVLDTVANGGTFTAGDTVNGNGGIDTLNLTITDNTKTAVTTMTNVERFIGTVATAGAPAGISAATWTGLTEVGAKGTITTNAANSAFTVTNIANNVLLSLDSITVGSNNDVALSAAFGADKVGSSTATLNISTTSSGASGLAAGIKVATAGSDVFTKLNIAATGSNYVYLTTPTDANVEPTSLTVTGSGSLALTSDGAAGVEFTGITTVDASTNQGGLTINMAGNPTGTTGLSFTGGSGADKLTLDQTDLSTAMTLVGGAGTDRLTVSNVSNTADSTVISAAQGARVSSFETLKATTAGTLADGVDITVDASTISGLTDIQLGAATGTAGAAASTFNVTNLNNGGKVTILGNQSTDLTNALTFKASVLADTTRSMTVVLGDSAAKTGATVDSLSTTQVTDLTYNSVGAANTITAQTTDNLVNLNVTGNKQLTLSAAVLGTGLKTIDASGLVLSANTDTGLVMGAASTTIDTTGKALTVTGSNGADTLYGSAVAGTSSTLKGGAGADTLNGHANSIDTFLYTAVTDSGTTTATGDTINTFDTTKDVIKFSGVTFTGTFSIGSGAFTAGGNASAYYDAATTSLRFDTNGDGQLDMLINGASLATVTTGNITIA